jgi:O-antigen/teichoic acid export membrane protein
MHILLLTARDWTDPRSGNAGMRSQVSRWLAWGHRVTVIAQAYPGCQRVEQIDENLVIHRMGSRRTLALRAGWATWRGTGRDADVVLEVIDGTGFFTAFWRWLRVPRVAMIDHAPASWLERVPLRFLYRLRPVITTSSASRDALIELGVAPERIHVNPTPIDDPDRAAQSTLELLRRTAAGGHVRMRNLLRDSETGKAVGLAAATLANNAIQLAFTIVFVRLLGTSGYGSLAALISTFLILLIGGQSIQAAAARELTLGRLGSNAQTSYTLRTWTVRLIVLLAVVSVFSVILRDPISRVIGVQNHPWAAAAVLPTGAMWMLLSLQRGALQGLRAFKPLGSSLIAEAALRIVFGLVLVGAGLGVTGAYLGTPLAFAGTSIGLAVVLHRRLAIVPGAPHEGKVRSLRSLIGQEWVPVVGLLCLGILQNVDVIMARHVLTHHQAGIYASAAVAAKAVLWVAIGLGLHLLPEATRRGAAGLDPRPVLYRALGVLGLVAAPALLIFWLFPSLLLRIAFGHAATGASSELVILGLAMTLLAVAYLTVMYMIALGENQFLWVVAVVAVLEPIVLGSTDAGLYSFAMIVLGVQCVAAAGVLVLGLSARFRTVPTRPRGPRSRASRAS